MSEPPPAESLHVLMIALGDQVLTEWGDTRERHLEYAERIAHLHMVVYSPRSRNLPETALSDHLTVYPTRSLTRIGFIGDAQRIGAEVCLTRTIDVITTQDPFTTGLVGTLLKRRFGIPLDVQNHSDFFDNYYWISERPLRYGLFNLMGRFIVRYADTHRVLNETEKAKYARLGVDLDRVVVLSTPVRLGRFAPDGPPGEASQLRKQLGIPDHAPVLLWVGKPGPVKRVQMLVTAFARVREIHPDAHLVLVGDFTLQPEVVKLTKRLGLSEIVHFPGKLAHEDLPAYYRLCDLYVHSSIYEGLGKVLIEAASCGKPAVSTRTAGALEIVVDNETGLLCQIDNPGDMATKIITLLNDPDHAAQMGAAARAYVREKFDHTRNLDAVIETWRRTTAMKRHP